MTQQPSLIFNLEYCGSCNGTCAGCLLTQEERDSKQTLLAYSDIVSSFKTVLAENPSIAGVNFAALAFGRGNTLSLNEETWTEMKSISSTFLDIFKPKNHVIEFSTGLIGKIDDLLYSAKSKVVAFGDNSRFVVVANSDLFSSSYWKNVDRFFEEMMNFRGGRTIDESGDILVLNLVANRLPPVEHVISKLKDYPFPVNLAWLPLYGAISDTEQFYVSQWLGNLAERILSSGLDSSLIDVTLDSFKESPTLIDSITKHNNGQVWWLGSGGYLNRGVFTVLGDVDFSRWRQKLGVVLSPDLSKVHRLIKARSACSKCKWQNECISTGSIFHAIASQPTSYCPTGMQNVFNLLLPG